MPQTRTIQKQSGEDQSRSTKLPSVTESTRTEPAVTTTSRTESGEEVSTSVTAGNTSRAVTKERIGATLSFTIKVSGNPPPKALPAST